MCRTGFSDEGWGLERTAAGLGVSTGGQLGSAQCAVHAVDNQSPRVCEADPEAHPEAVVQGTT